MKKRFLTMLSLIIVLCGLLVGCGDLSHGSISRNRPIDTTAKGSEDLVPEQADSLPEQEVSSMECSENVPDTTFAEDNIDIPKEYLTENGNVEYTVNENGEYVWNGLLFRHKLVLTSRATRDKHFIFVYIVLTNDTGLTNEKIFKDSLSSQAIPLDVTQKYPSFYVVLGNHALYEELHDSEDPVPEQADLLPEQEGNNMECSENVPDTTSTEDNIDIPEEYLTENYDVEYTVNENGEYVWNGLLFRHKLVVTSRDPRDKHFISIYIVLTNDTELTVEKISKDHLSSYIVPLDVTQEYPSYYVVLGNHVYEEPH